jgi:AcrR family transcriptional regulator
VVEVVRPMRADARRNHARLLAAARAAFTQHGYEASLDDIAKSAEVGPGTLYRHFPTREALLAAVYREDVEALVVQADELAERLPPEEALTSWLLLQLGYIKFKVGMGSAIKTMLGNDSQTLSWCRETLYGGLRRLLDRAQEAGVIRTDVDVIHVMRLVHGVGLASESAPEMADFLMSVVIDGLRTPKV